VPWLPADIFKVGLPHDAYDLGSNANKELYDFVGDIQWVCNLITKYPVNDFFCSIAYPSS
jgi:hypothetical protein